ncbi:MAG TPA: M28 family peptidase, partial [Blastocatellia bacterium]|nr:M28 family peptidase [Blastocatellia bacterium]
RPPSRKGITRMKRLMTLVLSAALCAAPVLAQVKKPKAAATATFGNVEEITAAQLKAYLGFIASDEMEGRDTPSKGLDITARFLAAMMQRWGVQPAGENGTYFQKMTLQRSQVEGDKTHATINNQRFKYGEDFLVSSHSIPGTISGNCVYVGHGFVFKASNINAYQTPNGLIDVKDKILIVGGGIPNGVAARDFRGRKGVDYLDAVDYAQQNGAKAVIRVPSYLSLSNWRAFQSSTLERKALLPIANDAKPPIPELTVSVPMLGALFAGEIRNGLTIFNAANANQTVEPFPLEKTISLTIGGVVERIPTQNVIGVLPGSDPVLKNEYVAIGAHYDHVGVGMPINGDAIYNGADDDGSGTTAVLAIAETLAKGQRPKRSMLFIWHCGEEKGLWGSEYFTNHPTVDLKQIVTQLNIDMIGRSKKDGDTNARNRELSGPNEIYVIGSKMMSTELGELSERLNNNFLKLSFNYKYDDPNDPNRFFFRSDHFNYAQKGIPIIFYFDGEHEDYHRPSDHVDKIDFQKMEKVTRTIYATAWELGNAASRPKVDKKLPAELSGN